MYFYACRFLLERVSWFCRDSFNPQRHQGDGSMNLIFSKRKNLSYEELREYLDRLENLQNTQSIRIDWDCLRTGQIYAYSASQKMGLQVADAVASSAFHALNKSAYGYTESKCVLLLRPTMYSHNNRIWGYGFKVWPEPNNEPQRKLFSWLFNK